MKQKKTRVIVAMSGGVDSSVAAYLMKRAGYEVIGVFLKCWSATKDFRGECSWRQERRDALRIAAKLEIPLVTVDAEKEYKKYVIDEMFKDYKEGITPNPDILCNEVVKFPFLLKQAKKFKAELVVTGHYARKKKIKNKEYLLRGNQESKDQSYFLYRIKEKDLKKMLFPIGDYTKEEVRKIAKEQGFLNYDKKSTVGICFIGKIPMKDFLKTKIKSKKGLIKDSKGNVVGEHDGVHYYTIGQRLGPRQGISLRKNDEDRAKIAKWYVAKKDIKNNEIIAAPAGHDILYRKKIKLKNFHLISEDKKTFLAKIKRKQLRVFTRIRHVGELIPSKLSFDGKGVWIDLEKKLDGVSNGQAAVLYVGERVLGGGEITS